MFWCREWVREAATQPSGKSASLYSRLSVGDEDRDGGESNSIVNQKAFLERYARQQKLTNIRHYIDDDESDSEKPDTLEFAPFIAIFARKYSGIEYRKIVLSQRYSTD